ncbi:MAG TPA: serine/threonine-protein kinase, partial [Kofleriaceae bacterium]|nr:serine/threonine-protein kinase [Kofleriaceae bacterium]
MKRCPNCGKQYPDDANFCPADAGRLEPDPGPDPAATHRGHAPAGADEPEADSRVGGRFELEDAIGGGLTGAVHRARDVQSGEACAVKLVDARVFPSPLLLQRAERELKQLERVQLPEVARVLAHGRRGDQLWIAMELVGGTPLDQLVAGAGPLPAPRACAIVRAVAHGLAAAAKQGVIHRDLAAKNVLVGEGDAVKIINFSVAVPFSDRVQGVPEFLSPEQVDGKPADQRSSIYSLGALLYLALTGRPPFTGDAAAVHQAHLGQEPVPPSQLAGVPPAVDGVVMRALEKASARRFMTLHQLISELDGVLQNGAAAQPAARGKGVAAAPPASTLIGVSAFGGASGASPAPAHAGGAPAASPPPAQQPAFAAAQPAPQPPAPQQPAPQPPAPQPV